VTTATRPAPGRLALVQDFLNTNDIEAGTDQLGDGAAARRWLAAAGLGDGVAVGDRDAGRLRAAREAIRELVAANGGRPLDPEAAAELTRIAGRARGRTALVGGRLEVVPEGAGADAAIAAILLAVADATTDGTFGRLRICDNDACRWSFYDASKNGRSRWCSASVCGNRAHTRAYRRRRATDKS
jgi:predicted RNA-binding Zn ribbon-like protein